MPSQSSEIISSEPSEDFEIFRKMAKPLLYTFFHSSCSWRVRMALAYKEIDYDIKTINLDGGDQRQPEFLKVNPLGQIPVLVVNGISLMDSIAIMEYLDEAFPQKPLLPQDLFKRAKVRQICEIITSGIQPLQSPFVAAKYSKDPDKQFEWLNFYISKGFVGLEKTLLECSGKYCVGDQLTVADLCLVPQVFNAWKRFNIEMEPYPTVLKIYKTLLQMNEVRSTHPFVQDGCPPELQKQSID